MENLIVLENKQGVGSAKYVVLGDSLSAGVGSADVNKTFPYIYGQKLSEKYEKVNLVNLAQPGGTTVEVIQNQIPRALEEKPDFVTLLIGINDIHNKRTLNDFNNKYDFILNELLTKTDAKIMIMDLPYIGADKVVYPPFNFLLDFRTKQFNKIISHLADKYSNTGRVQMVSLYKDTYSLCKNDTKYYSPDLFHPSEDGYLLWGQIICAH